MAVPAMYEEPLKEPAKLIEPLETITRSRMELTSPDRERQLLSIAVGWKPLGAKRQYVIGPTYAGQQLQFRYSEMRCGIAPVVINSVPDNDFIRAAFGRGEQQLLVEIHKTRATMPNIGYDPVGWKQYCDRQMWMQHAIKNGLVR